MAWRACCLGLARMLPAAADGKGVAQSKAHGSTNARSGKMAAQPHDSDRRPGSDVKLVGRVRADLEVEGRPFWTLFDTGARNTYVVEEVAALCLTFSMPRAEPVALGGRTHQINRSCVLLASVEGLPIHVQARVLPEIGRDELGRPIQILLGALAMQEWGIIPIPQEERLDLTNYPKEFVEFCVGEDPG